MVEETDTLAQNSREATDFSLIDATPDTANLSPNEQKKLDKEAKALAKKKDKWKVFVDFLLRHLSIVTTKYAMWEKEDFEHFKEALEKAQMLDEKESTNVARTYKKLKERADILSTRRYYGECNKIKKYIDLIARLRGLSLIARDFFKSIKKGKLEPLEQILDHLAYWKGFVASTFDIGELNPKGVDSNHPGMKYVMWLCLIRTILHLGQRFLKCASELTEIPLVAASCYVSFNLTEEQMAVCGRLEEILATHVTKATGVQTSDIGGSRFTSLNFSGLASGLDASKRLAMAKTNFQLPGENDYLTFELPDEPPKEKKKKKKGKKKRSAKKKKKR